MTFANYNVPSIFHSTDGGITWDDISGNLEENLDGTGSGPSVLWAENYPDGTLFVGTTVGLFTTTFPKFPVPPVIKIFFIYTIIYTL